MVTSRAFLEKLPALKAPGKITYLEDLAQNPGRIEKLVALWMTWFLPVRVLEKALGRTTIGHVETALPVDTVPIAPES